MKARSPSSSTPTKRSKHQGNAASASAWTCAACLDELRRLGTRANVDGMARFGIRSKIVYGVPKPQMELLAKRVGREHQLALELWDSGVHDARILAGMVDDARNVTAAQMDRWLIDFDNWEVCDGTCCHLFVRASPGWRKAIPWSRRTHEFQKRAGYALMAYLAIHDKQAPDGQYLRLLSLIRRAATDDRNFVRKAVNWALRQIGKRNFRLNQAAIREATQIAKLDSKSARWIAADALRELRSDAVQRRLNQKHHARKAGSRHA